MLWIVHQHFDEICDEWHTVLSTFDQLSIVPIKSSKLPDSYTKTAQEIAESYTRLPAFTTCFSSDTLCNFVMSLVQLSEAVSFASPSEQNLDISRENSESFSNGDINDDFASAGRDGIGGKLMSFAGRAFGGGGSQPSINPNVSFRRSGSDAGSSQSSKTYSEDFRELICSQMLAMKLSTPSSTIRKLPLPLLLLTVVAEANAYRFSVVEEVIAVHLCDLVAKAPTMELRSFSMETLIHFIPLSLSESDEHTAPTLKPTSLPIDRYKNKPLGTIQRKGSHDEGVEDIAKSSPEGKSPLLKILCQTMQITPQPDTAETGLNALHIVLEEAGHDLSRDNLITVVETLSVLAGWDDYGNETDKTTSISRSSKAWANVSAKSFQNLKLILDEFLEPITSTEARTGSSDEARRAIIECCVAFGKSRHDVNTSLTATGMLWTLADQDATPGTLDVVLSKLSFLALDNRPELRNCSVNTLFSCAVGLGDKFTDAQWEKCLNQTVFGIMRDISFAINGSDSNQASSSDEGARSRRYKVAVHHSRDSATKQWSTTQVLVLRGLERVLRLFFARLLATTTAGADDKDPWFLQTWKAILRTSLECATLAGGRETLDVRLAGIELALLCSHLSCKAGLVASAASARVGTNMEVVGGALRSVRAATTVQNKDQNSGKDMTIVDPEVEKWRDHLFDLSFAALGEYRVYLEQLDTQVAAEAEKKHMLTDSVQTQVLTKLVGELSKLYECCKGNEMLPGVSALQLDIFVEDDDCYESRFVHLILTIMNNADSDYNSRYLNQVQRGTMSLLQAMASNSSLRAFKALITLSGDYMFV